MTIELSAYFLDQVLPVRDSQTTGPASAPWSSSCIQCDHWDGVDLHWITSVKLRGFAETFMLLPFFKRLQLGRILDPSATSRGLNRNQYLPRLQCQIPTIQEPHVLVDGDSRGVMVWGKRWENLNKKKWRLPSTWFTCESFGWSWHCSIFT